MSMTKHERKMLKRQKKASQREEHGRKTRNKKVKNYLITSVVITAFIIIFYVMVKPAKDAPMIEINPSSFNFGQVSQAKGAVEGLMTITNRGFSDLIINNMDTSCGCTSASIVQDGKEGPRFSMAMHGTNPRGWSVSIPPGESVKLKVYYDPSVHRELRGSVTRFVSVFSNDPRNKKKDVTIRAVQVD